MKARDYNSDPRARTQALELARAEGRAGAGRLSDEVLLATGPDPSDTFIGLALDQLEAGRRARQNDPAYRAAVNEELLQLPEAV